MTHGGPHPRNATPRTHGRAISRRRFFFNIILLLALVASLAIWFHRHIQSFRVESILVGGTLTIWGLFELLRAALEWAAEDEMKDLPQKVLGNRHSTEYLVLGMILSGFLHGLTSSINIEYEPTGDREPRYKVAVLYRTNGLPFLQPLEVTSNERLAGRPYLFRSRSVPLRIALVEPRGYEPVDVDFGIATSMHLRVPVDFKPKEFHLVRLVPGPKLLNLLPEPGQDAQAEYELDIVRQGRTNQVGDLRRQILYVGAAADDMRDIVAREKVEGRRADLNSLLAGLGFPPENRAKVIDTWEVNPGFKTTEEFAKNDPIEIIVRSRNNPAFLIKRAITNEENREIKSLLLQP